ncbi:MAG: hypothetical protein LBI85_07710 [Spirochaetaceae bacterium]|jgi:hypothetical protein|nr:hypothetical protein [Spirochaetaceae bacterium]
MADYIPSNDALFDQWFKFLNQYVAQKCGGSTPEWTHIPQTARTAMSDAYAAWYTAYANTLKPHTPVETEIKNEAKEASRAGARAFVNQYLRFPPVTDADRTAMGIHNKDIHPTPIKPPETGPEFSITQMGPRRLGIVYRNGGKGKKGSKPAGVRGARIYYGVFDAPPPEQEALPASTWATRCPHTVSFRETDRGRRAYFALKWEIQKENGESPWSEIQSELVP